MAEDEEDEFVADAEEETSEAPLNFSEPSHSRRGSRGGRPRRNKPVQEPLSSIQQDSGVSVEDLAKALSEQLKTPVEEFVESIEGIQNQIPVMVKKGIAQVLVAVQADIQNVVENRVNALIYQYTESLKKQQQKIGFKIYGIVVSMAVFSVAAIVAMAWYMTPSWKEIQTKKEILQSLNKSIKKAPYEVQYLGKTYVRIAPDSEIVLHGHDGNHTYAIPTNPEVDKINN